MSYATFLSAVLALLLAPGPTNTLMALAGAQRGMGRVLRLMPAELGGYLTTILPLTWAGAEVLHRWPAAAAGLKLAAAAWVMVLAAKLWGLRGADEAGAEVGARRVWLTTVLNPKALIFGLVLLPAPSAADYLPKLALFMALVLGVATLWGGAGTLTRAGGGAHRQQAIRRAASVWLAFVALTLVTGVIRA